MTERERIILGLSPVELERLGPQHVPVYLLAELRRRHAKEAQEWRLRMTWRIRNRKPGKEKAA
jgi:hypothetical protein